MIYTVKSGLTTSNGGNFGRQDISSVISLTSTRPRPVSMAAEQKKATNTLHSWVEQGRNSAFTGATSYSEGGTPTANALAPNRPSNKTCKVGALAQVSDTMKAVFSGGGQWTLAEGEEEKQVAQALDMQVALATLDVLDDIEAMHVVGDSTVTAGFPGGQTDGLVKWITASGVVVSTGGTSTVPVFFSEQFLKDGARTSAEAYPAVKVNKMLVPPELIPDVNNLIASGAGRPLNVVVPANKADGTIDLVAGQSVGYYNNGYSVVKVEEEPNLSPLYNSAIAQPAVVCYNDTQVAQANLIALGVEELARTGTARQKMITCEFAQEHRLAPHAHIIPNVKSAVA